MEKQKRFYYSQSNVYGWCVYDRHTHRPAYEACADLLAPINDPTEWSVSGMVMVSPVLLESEYKAMTLCRKLNKAYWDYCAERGFED